MESRTGYFNGSIPIYIYWDILLSNIKKHSKKEEFLYH